MSPDVERALSWDLRPLRPWEYWQVDASEWTEAVTIQVAYQEGIATVKERERHADHDEQRRQALVERMSG